MADAGGAWATFHGADGRPLDGHGARLDPQVLGLNVDALLFAITGIRQAAYANWDDEDIRLELRLPAGATWFTARGAHKDGRTLDLFFREEIAPLSEAERAANDELAPERRRDPTVPHRRVNFVVDLVEGEPAKGYYDVAINAEGTVYVRYLQPGAPAAPEQPDLRRIEETEFAAEDALAFLPARTGPAPAPAARQRSIPAGAELLVLTCRGAAADALGGAGVTLFDTAQPFAPAELEGLLLGEGRARHRRLYLDWRYQAPAPAGWNSGYFASPAWTDLLARYRSAGGEVLEPGFVRRFEVGGRASEAEADGGLALPDGDENLRVVARIEGSAAGAEAVLRLGTNAPLGLGLGGQSFATQGDPQAEPDRVAWLAQLAAGTNELVLTISPRPDGGPRRLYLRASDPAGLPLR
jgi:hypothetical protein